MQYLGIIAICIFISFLLLSLIMLVSMIMEDVSDSLRKKEEIKERLDKNMNKYWDSVSKIAKKQVQKGLTKDCKPLEDNVCMDVLERIQMIEEELVDALFCLEHLKERIK